MVITQSLILPGDGEDLEVAVTEDNTVVFSMQEDGGGRYLSCRTDVKTAVEFAYKLLKMCGVKA